MPSYSYRASTIEGKLIESSMEAADKGTVSAKLQEMGLLPIHIGSAGKESILQRQMEWSWKSKKVKTKDVLVFTHELHTLTRAGFPLDRCLTIAARLAENPAMTEVVRDVLKEVKTGKSF